MLFLGPPGAGKTEAAKRFAKMLKQLELLPTDRFEYTTAGNLIDRYIGGTGNNTLEAMRRAKGGVLFIDEAYAMLPGKGNWFGKEILHCLLENVTTEEFKGKIIIILGGYEDAITQLFAMNPGFQSRFDKMRVVFPSWTGAQSAVALVRKIQSEGKSITSEAEGALANYFESFAQLPNWASARDVFENIWPALEAARAERSFTLNKEKRILEEAQGIVTDTSKKTVRKGQAAKDARATPIPYELHDVQKVFDLAIRQRGGDVSSGGGPSPTRLRPILNRSGLKDLQSLAAKQNKLLVICYNTPSSCSFSKAFAPIIESTVSDFRDADVVFGLVNGDKCDDQFWGSCDVHAVPCVRFFSSNNRQVNEIVGLIDAEGFAEEIRQQLLMSVKQTRFAVPPSVFEDSFGGGGGGSGGGPSAPPKHAVKHAVKVEFKVKKKDDESDGDDDDEEDEDYWSALEAAIGELGWSNEKVKDMLEDVSNFPPPEIMAIVMRLTNAKKPGKVRLMLSQQRGKVLEQVKLSLQLAKQAKTEEEARVQEKLKRIGKCCAGFEWLKIEGGYQCAGGSHFCSDMEIEG